MRLASDWAWSRSLDCTPARKLAFSKSDALAPWPFTWFQVAVMISFWRCEIWFWSFSSSSPPPPPPPRLLGLRVVALEGLRFDEEHVGADRLAGVLGGRVDAHDVAGHDVEILEREGGRAAGGLAVLRRHRHDLFGAAVDGVVERDLLEAEIVLGLDGDGDFFDRAGLEVAARAGDFDLGRLVLHRLDEVVVVEADIFAAFDRGDVIGAVLEDGHAGDHQVVGARRAAGASSRHPGAGLRWRAGGRR